MGSIRGTSCVFWGREAAESPDTCVNFACHTKNRRVLWGECGQALHWRGAAMDRLDQVWFVSIDFIACLVGWMDGWMDVWVGGWMGEWVDGWVGGWVDGWID